MSSCRIKMTDNQLLDVYRRDISLKAAMIKAVKENQISALKIIFEHDGWPKSYIWLDYYLLMEAIKLGHKEITNILLDNGAPVFMKANVNTPLHLAAAKSNSWLDIMERLVEKGARVSENDGKTYSPLHIAFTMEASDEKTDLLLGCHLRQSSSNVVNENGLSFLHIACSRPHLEFVRKIVEANKDSINDTVIQLKCTPLHFAVEYGRHEIAEFLIKNGADINSQNVDGSTPLHYALKRRDPRMADVLLAHKVDRKNIINKYNLSHFMVACIGSKVDIVKEFLDMPNSEDFISAKINSLSNCVGYTCLHLAVDLGTIKVVEFLLDHGADCCALAINGTTTPHTLADKRQSEDMRGVLVEHCWLWNRSKKLRAQSPDFGMYGWDHEKNVLIERTRNLKYHRRAFKKLKHMDVHIVQSDDVSIEDLWDSVGMKF